MLDNFQRKQRARYLGSSDAPALAGVDPFGRNQVDVWLEKTGKLQPVKQREEINSPKVVGTYLEGGILSWVEDVIGSRLARDQFRIHNNGIMAANFDALALAATPPAPVEAKVCGMFGLPKYFEDFGEEGSDDGSPDDGCGCRVARVDPSGSFGRLARRLLSPWH